MNEQGHKKQHAALSEALKQQGIINGALREEIWELQRTNRAFKKMLTVLASHQGLELNFDALEEDDDEEDEE